MNNYEFMLILNPLASEDERNATIDVIKTILKDVKAKITNEEIWGDKKLAYTINKADRAYYILYTIDADPESLKSMTKELNLEKDVWRHMFVRQEA